MVFKQSISPGNSSGDSYHIDPIVRLYYFIKPLLPQSLRLFLRRRRARHILPGSSDIWPIDPSAAQKPAGFTGWPGGKRFCLLLTHDVESAKGLNGVKRLMEAEKALGFRSSFNFVAADYQVPASTLDDLRSDGFEIGVHGLHHDHRMFLSEAHFRTCARKVNECLIAWGAVGYRSPSTLHNLDWFHYLNIRYDSSTSDTDPFEPQPDPLKTIFPMVVHAGHHAGSYIELPYTLPQDMTLFILLEEKSTAIWRQKLDWIARNGGMAQLLVHSDYMAWDGQQSDGQYPGELYLEFLRYIKDTYGDQYWNGLPREVADFWLTNCADDGLITHDKRLNTHTGRRICMPSYSYYDSDNRVRRYAETLVREGHSVDIISLRRKGQARNEIINGVHVARIQLRSKQKEDRPIVYLLKILLFLLRSGAIISARHLRERYDLVHAHNIPDFIVFSALVPKMLGCKVILDIHDIVPELYVSKFAIHEKSGIFKGLCAIEKLSASFADHVIISNDLWKKTVTDRSVPESNCSVLINYPDSSIFRRSPDCTEEGKEIILYPGSLNQHQGLDIAIGAFALVADQLPKAEFHIYGEGPSKGMLIDRVLQAGLEKRVLFKDPIPTDKIAEMMRGAKLGVVPKKAEFFGNQAFSTKIMEFMAVGVPVIVSDTEIDRYYFNDSLVLFFKSGDVQDLARKMVLMMTDEELRRTFIRNSGEFIKGQCWDVKKSQYLDLVERLTGGNSGDHSAPGP
jgi:glycosyltransferase involved in cell wall biosynthesis/peptidoglycan/xylan/chitin deacetylase (PgdA/CDA1 family)